MISLLYATHDGHTRKIAQTLGGHLVSKGQTVCLTDLGHESADRQELEESQIIVIVAPIRYGYHLKPVEAFIAANKALLREKTLVMASVNLTARKPEKNRPETNLYMRKWLRRTGLKPTLAHVFAGFLNYSLYRLWEKWAIRLIMAMTGGPTDFKAVVDYTDWAMVDSFAAQIASLPAERKGKAA